MTTGRINQVTIVSLGASRHAKKGDLGTEGARPEGRALSRYQGRGRTIRCGSQPEPHWGAEAHQERRRAIQMPPLSSPKDGPPQRVKGHDPKGSAPRCDIRLSREGYQLPVTPGSGYGLRLTPECLLG